MRKQEEKQVTKTETIEVAAVCNKCGKDFVNENDDYFWDAEIHNFSVDFGYGSKYDMERWNFDLCEDCLVEIIKTFKYVPEGFMYGYLDPEKHQKVFENWKETGEWEEFKYHTYEELVEMQTCYNTEYINEIIKKYHPDKPLLDELEDPFEELVKSSNK